MTICARTEAILNGNDELLDLITAQAIDNTDKIKGEYLGGNGVAQWHHVKGHIHENSGFEGDSLGEHDGLERAVLQYTTKSHQAGIESNGAYNVRQLAHWKGGFDGETFIKREARVSAKRADHGYKIDRRKKVGAKAEMLKEMRKTLSNKEYQREVRRMKREGIL